MITLAIATCGSILAKLGLDKEFKDVEIRDHTCSDVTQYCSAGLKPTVELISPSHLKTRHYPQCGACYSCEPCSKEISSNFIIYLQYVN